MVIGDVSLAPLSGWLSRISKEIGRGINPHFMSIDEFRKRKQSGEHFINRVLESTKIFIKGSEDDLAEMGE